MATVVSAPGKVFLAGGYLVLDRAYTALVFGLSARIHIVVKDAGAEQAQITVQSPQFRDAVWTYSYAQAGDQGGVVVTQTQGSSSAPLSRNPFVETALSYALTYIATQTPSPIRPVTIIILADNNYYSQPSTTPLSSHPQFLDFAVRLQDAHKTGLGSSAALVTAFTGALLSHYLPSFSLTTSAAAAAAAAAATNRKHLHNLAQAAHCAAQGKVGSGFDIATAVYGTCVYRRFSPSILASLGEPGSAGFSARVKDVVEDTNAAQVWDTEVSKSATLPQGMALVMCDVDCGSETVGMVKKVLEWKKQDPAGSKELWDALQRCNETLAAQLSSSKSTTNDLQQSFAAIREKIRDMGSRSGVPIEPPEQTELLDAVTSSVDGVAGGVVPGAGGYDAIVLLVRDDEATREQLIAFLAKWSKEKGSNVKLLGAKGELEGARVEDAGRYTAL